MLVGWCRAAGVAASVVSTVEDIGSVLLSILSILMPVLVIVAVPLLIWWVVAAKRPDPKARPFLR